VLDIGCGTGSATLLSALRGARATGVDPARRLLQVGRDDATRQGLEARFLCGDAAALPVGDGVADVVLSSFGLIFADDPVAAAAEIARVRAPRGRVVFTAWAPGNALDRAFATMIVAFTRALAEHGIAAPTRFAWHDTEALTTLFAPLGLSPRLEHHELAMTGESVSAYFDECIATHPLWVSAAALLADSGEFQSARDTIIETLAHANEDPTAFQITSRYVVVRLDAVPAGPTTTV
jgi:SAM-dependent methyltransferase